VARLLGMKGAGALPQNLKRSRDQNLFNAPLISNSTAHSGRPVSHLIPRTNHARVPACSAYEPSSPDAPSIWPPDVSPTASELFALFIQSKASGNQIADLSDH